MIEAVEAAALTATTVSARAAALKCPEGFAALSWRQGAVLNILIRE